MRSLDDHNVLFIYDSLMRGKERAGFLSREKARFIGAGSTPGVLFPLGDFPGLVIHPLTASSKAALAKEEKKSTDDGDMQIHGELFEIFDPDTFLETLDLIEGYWPDQPERSLFVRKLIPVETKFGAVNAWAYILNLPASDLLRFDSDDSA